MKRAALLVLLVASVLAPVAVTASSPPQPLCSVCDDSFERAADRHDVEATVVESTVEVEVAEDGTARWTVRNRLANESTADHLRVSDTLLDEVVAKALDGYSAKPDRDRVSDVSSRVDDDTVMITFADDSFADRDLGGVVVVEHFHTGGDRRGQGFDVDRFAVVGPDGFAVVNDPEDSEVDDGRVTWVNDGTEREYGTDTYLSDTYVAFARDDGVVTDAALHLAFARRALPAVADNLFTLVPAVVVVAGGLAAFRTVARAELVPQRSARLAAAVVGVGLLAVIHPAYAGTVPLVNDTIPALAAAGVVYVLVGGTALALDRAREAIPWWLLLAPAVGVLVLAGMPIADFGHPAGQRIVSGNVLLAVPVATAFPLGYAVANGDARAQQGAAAATLVALVTVALRHVSFVQKPFVGGLVAIVAGALAAFGLAFALPLYLLGASLARDARADP